MRPHHFIGIPATHGISGTLSDRRPFPFNGLNRPSSILATEEHLIENRRNRCVEMAGPAVNDPLDSAWPGSLNGN